MFEPLASLVVCTSPFPSNADPRDIGINLAGPNRFPCHLCGVSGEYPIHERKMVKCSNPECRYRQNRPDHATGSSAPTGGRFQMIATAQARLGNLGDGGFIR